MKHLVIAEKPSVARDIARVLGCGKKNNSYMEGKDYVVTWALDTSSHWLTRKSTENSIRRGG